jgi:hypothetical protein
MRPGHRLGAKLENSLSLISGGIPTPESIILTITSSSFLFSTGAAASVASLLLWI